MQDTVLNFFSPSEIIDRWLVLRLKFSKLGGDDSFIQRCLSLKELIRTKQWLSCGQVSFAMWRLRKIHAALWDLEDQIRDAHKNCPDGDYWHCLDVIIVSSKRICELNERRGELKKQIDSALGQFAEPKSYGRAKHG